MNNEVLFTLLRMGLGTERSNGNSVAEQLASLVPNDWVKIYRIGARQGVAAIMFDAIQRLPSLKINNLAMPEASLTVEWFVHTRQTEQHYILQQKAIQSLASIYAENDIRMMVFKGYAASLLYDIPERRVGGDVDIYLMGDGEKADELVASKGVAVTLEADKHSAFDWEGVHFENHAVIVSVRGANKTPMSVFEDLMEYEAKNNSVEDVGIGNVWLPSATFNALFLPYHMACHWVRYQSNLRQVCDWALFLNKQGEKVDWNVVCENAERLGFSRFLNALNHLVVSRFGVREECIANGEKDEELSNQILYDIMCPKKVVDIPHNVSFMRGCWLKSIRFWRHRKRSRLIRKQSFARSFYNQTMSYLHGNAKLDNRSIWKMKHVAKRKKMER